MSVVDMSRLKPCVLSFLSTDSYAYRNYHVAGIIIEPPIVLCYAGIEGIRDQVRIVLVTVEQASYEHLRSETHVSLATSRS